MKHISIIGTGTDIGKTICSLTLLNFFKDSTPLYYKPIQCGTYPIIKNGITSDGGDIDWIQSQLPSVSYKNTYFFKSPTSPHYAATIENQNISMETLKKSFALCGKHFPLIITESAGGLCVPLTEKGELLLDVLPPSSNLILVCSPYLGTLNHTLLSYNYLKQKGRIPNGFIMIHSKPETPSIFQNNIETILKLTQMKYFGEIPYLEEIANQKPFNLNILHQQLTSDFHSWGDNFLS